MSGETECAVQSAELGEFSQTMRAAGLPRAGARRLNIDPEQVKNGLAQLALTLVKLLHELMERQAIRRIDQGDLERSGNRSAGNHPDEAGRAD